LRVELQQPTSDDYARLFVAAVRVDLKVRRNQGEIEAFKKRLTANTGG
jgi:hypothetical protein